MKKSLTYVMNHHIENPPLRPILRAALAYLVVTQVHAQTFTTLQTFTCCTNGWGPHAPVIVSGNALYGTASQGGTHNGGTVFKLNTDGTSFTTLYNDGNAVVAPQKALVLSGNRLYGTSSFGGLGYGTVFAINTDGTGFALLHIFSPPTGGSGLSPCDAINVDGVNPSSLVLSGSTLYGTTCGGGDSGSGTVFAVNTDGSGFTTLYTFSVVAYPPINPDGASPNGLVLSGQTLYGTTYWGGNSQVGTIFSINTDGSGFTVLHTFEGDPTDGAWPIAGMVVSNNTLYGTTSSGGSTTDGTVFSIHTDGTGMAVLHSFPYSDGNSPGCLILSAGVLYGTASSGGSAGNGTVFALNPDGSAFRVLHSFTATHAQVPSGFQTNSDGTTPNGLCLAGNTLYGTAQSGGDHADGTVFSISLAAPSLPRLAITGAPGSVILTWPTNAAGFTLQSTTNIASPVAWANASPAPVIVNDQYTVTNSVLNARQYYRLIQ